ncbi:MULTISPECIES: HAMP domain-containing sensor histidine kinase [Clostridium]|uniref:HAMP domain-containing sensor histidine kinase n=1 Tax=Clostridium TaxID=1485 RepID=UPI00024BB160|nr:HAMP domain-containing sensor histidine kinase [Clostridium sporogenes]STC73956.1 histidine kinase [Clostridium botulinum]EHN15239.1 histidine kinase [Clostridium sporogenes PA 3679]MCW6105901.1 HAMP domain-containing histidine kinase [Clostridium sporogenes]MDU4596509.1 HAMP domain-containing sensor histidine kinase [Clostridium sporogenes]NFQ33350.1 HAMP domain-containing histidine kinase [Clostridium sporogenes]
MKKKLKIKYNLILGVFIGFFLSQLVIAEGYAILVGNKQNNSTIAMSLPDVEIRFLKVLSIVVFIGTVAIFCTKRFREINFNKISIYLILVVVLSTIIAIEGVIILVAITLKLNPNIQYLIRVDYFISINFFFITCFIGIFIFIVTFIFFVNRKVNYIKFLTKQVNAIKGEGFGKTIKVKGQDELAQLCSSINNMSIELGEKIENEKKIENSKNELITNISHDLKTPLTSLVGYLDLLNKGDIKEETKEEYIKIAYNKSLRLKELVDELFEYTKITNHNIKIERLKYNISNLINQIVGESILDFLENNIELKLQNPYKELYYEIDVKLFTRLIENLIKNAEKYSDPNSVFQVIVEEKEKNIEISFINHCEQLQEKDLEKIFEKFYRVDRARSNDKEGSGLGLSIAKQIVKLHNGDLIVEKKNKHIMFKIILYR